MRSATIFWILSLANCCFFLAAATSRKKIDCSQYEKDEEGRLKCPTTYSQVCATDGVTSASECRLCARILKGALVDLAHKGECVDCRKFPHPPPGSHFDCPQEDKAVCGTDGKTYPHKCVLCAQILTSNIRIGISHEGNCQKG